MKTNVLWLMVAVAAAASTGYAQRPDPAPVAGTWNMTVKGPAAHGDMAATLVLTQSERKVSGTLSAHGNEHKLAGEFADGALTLATTDTREDARIELRAKLQENGTLAGYLSGPMGDMQWTATRAGTAQ